MKTLKELLIELETNKENIKRWLIRNLLGYGEITIMYAKLGSLKTGYGDQNGYGSRNRWSGARTFAEWERILLQSGHSENRNAFQTKGIDGEQVSRPLRGNWFKPNY